MLEDSSITNVDYDDMISAFADAPLAIVEAPPVVAAPPPRLAQKTAAERAMALSTERNALLARLGTIDAELAATIKEAQDELRETLRALDGLVATMKR